MFTTFFFMLGLHSEAHVRPEGSKSAHGQSLTLPGTGEAGSPETNG